MAVGTLKWSVWGSFYKNDDALGSIRFKLSRPARLVKWLANIYQPQLTQQIRDSSLHNAPNYVLLDAQIAVNKLVPGCNSHASCHVWIALRRTFGKGLAASPINSMSRSVAW